jgi:hypothetical protein
LASKKGYRLDKELSTASTKVFVNQRGVPTIGHRGSKRVSDWFDNALLAVGLGRFGPRHREAKAITQKVEAKYGKPANAIGHSLGGRLAETSGARGRVVTYNKAAGLADIGKRTSSNQVDYRTSIDLPSLLSVGQTGGRHVTVAHTPAGGGTAGRVLDAHKLKHLDSYLMPS